MNIKMYLLIITASTLIVAGCGLDDDEPEFEEEDSQEETSTDPVIPQEEDPPTDDTDEEDPVSSQLPCPADEIGISCLTSWECWKSDGGILAEDYYCPGDNTVCCQLEEVAPPVDNCTNTTGCGDWTIELQPNPPRIMMLQDMSSSMREESPTRWDQAKAAISSVIETYGASPLVHLGFDVYPNRRDCFADLSIVSDTAPLNGDDILALMELIDISQSTPLYMALGNFNECAYAPNFIAADSLRYLIVISDGKDTCGNESNHFPDEEYGATAEELGAQSALLASQGIHTLTIGLGPAADADQLNAIAENGGSDFQEYIPATNETELSEALHTMIADAIQCEFVVMAHGNTESPESTIDYDTFALALDGENLEQDPGCASGDGWQWLVQGTRLQLCDTACTQYATSSSKSVTVQFQCVDVDMN